MFAHESMLDLAQLKRIKLSRRPIGQLLVGNLVLRFDYARWPKTEIVIEGVEHIPKEGGAFFAMNHTDRYNYFPFQYRMYRLGHPFTATWVKGKYYEHPALAWFMQSTNNIPLPSRGYVLTTEFRKAIGRPPSNEEYRLLRDLVDGKRAPREPLPPDSDDLRRFLGSDVEAYLRGFHALFDEMMAVVVELTRTAIEDLGLNVLVFPEGTRSKRLGPGRTGLVQAAQFLGAPIVPVGCNGSDKAYPGNSPISKGGRLVYRVGEPLAVDHPELAPYRTQADVTPFTDEASARYGAQYQAITEIVMERISELLDPEYRDSEEGPGDSKGVSRFV